EYERDLQRTPYAWTQLYLTRIRYVDYTHESVKRHLCSVELAYADRPDPHSEFRQGFEIRTTRRCTAIRTYTHPLDANMPQGHPPSGTNTNTVAVKTYHLTYRDELGQQALNRVSLLADVRVEGHDAAASESLPPVEFEYTDFDIARRSLTTVNGAHLPALGLAHPDMDLVDLDGNGLPDLVQLSAGQPIRYWKNRGNGTFDRVRTMRNAPSGLALGSGAVQLMDADGDGRVDLVMNAPDFAGYYALDHNGEWDVDSFRPYATRPPLDLQSAQAQFIDLSGDGRTDVLINADRFICYFQNAPLLDVNRNFDGLQAERRAVGWSEARFVSKAGSDDFPNVNFGDPRIRTADLSGDGLQDIVQIENGRICYWPNLGYGRFGKRRVMRNSPRPGRDIDPAQLILGDADGDGLTDVILVEHDRITVWINQSGNGFSDPITIHGTPAFTRRDSVRPVDLLGTGTPGLLWSYALGDARDRFAYLDLTGGAKPYVMVGMRNNLGARTRVQYGSSVQHYLRDTYGRPTASDQQGDFTGYAGPWKTTLPFPVQVVDRVEVIDEISQGKLTTRYFYHHGYWDGAEREFRGFGRVDQFDTETFERYHTDDLILDAALTGVSVEHYAPPVLAKNWFHLGPVGAANGDWGELDLHSEYWSGDADMLVRDPDMLAMIQGLPRRARRDAYRTLRGTALRSELYAMDGSPLQQRPYTVSETQTGLRLVDGPATNATIRALAVETHSNCIFFSYGLGSRSTTWERGGDPMTKCSFTGAIDAYGQPLSQVSIAVPRGKDPRTGGELPAHTGTYDPARGYDATVQYTEYIHEDPATGGTKYMVNRVKKAHSYEAVNAGTLGLSVAALRALLLSGPPSGWTGLTHRLLGLAYTYYDGNDYDGLPYGQIGAYGMPVRTKTLVVQPAELTAAFGATHPAPFQGASAPDWSGHPGGFVGELLQPACGYRWHTGGSGPEQFVEGYYTTPQATQYDFQGWPGPHRGLPMVLRDAYGSETVITYDPYQFFPTSVMDPLYMVTYAAYDYRVMQPFGVLDPNENATFFAFTPLGLMHKTALMGKFAAPEGDTLAVPGVLLEYDLFAFMRRGEPVWVKTTQREHHVNAPYSGTMPPDEFNATIVAVEYSDGFGRQLQTRTQAEDVLFGVTLPPIGGWGLGDSGLPADQDAPNGPATATYRAPMLLMNVVVIGAKRYNNKGKVVEQWESYFSRGFALTDPAAPYGQRVRLFYDALGRPQRTVNPDGTQQRVVYGVPDALDTPDAFAPSPWERYSYDALDLAPITHPSTPPAPSDFTPKSEVIDALGRTVRTTEHKAHPTVTPAVYEDVVMRYAYDIQGRLLTVTDPLGRVNFQHRYDTAGNTLWSEHLDSGVRTAVADAQGKPLYGTDAKGARVYTSYDRLNRPTGLWARDKGTEPFTRRQTLIHGDQAGLPDPAAQNLKGRLYLHYDEAGKVQVAGYDFKGNPLEKTRWTIKDDILLMPLKHVVDWTPLDESILDATAYTTTLAYDALNRVRGALYPADVVGHRAMAQPTYNRAGALERIALDGIPYVRQIAYNAKGQRLLLTMANGVMTRYTYDPLTFRLLRIRSEKFDPASPDHPLIPNGGVQQDLGYQYDLGGNIIGIRDKAPANGSAQGPGDLLKQFTYDPLRRLLSATGRESTAPSALPQWDANVRGHDHTATNTYTRAYTYDQVGNVLKEQHTADGHPANSFTKTFTYHPTNAHNRLVDYRVGGYTFDLLYDANGNLVQEINSRHHQWGHADQLKYFMVRAGSSGPPSVYTHYLYGASGDRVKKVVNKPASGGGVLQEVTIYIDGVFEETYVRPLAADIDPDRHYNTLHVMDGRSRIATLRVGTDVDDPTPPTKFNLEDHLGTSMVMLDPNGNLVNREEYYPFGETCFGAFAKKRYRYVGKEKDNESGLYYYGARYYAPWMCRFISVDPLAAKYAHLNPYNYAGNKPIGDLDIDGMQGTGEDSAPDEYPLNRKDVNGEVVPIQLMDLSISRMTDETKAETFLLAFGFTLLIAVAVVLAAPVVLPFAAQAMAAVIGVEATAAVGTAAGAGLATYGAIQTGESAYAVATGKDFQTGEELSEEEYWSTAGSLGAEAVTLVPVVKAVRNAIPKTPKPGTGLNAAERQPSIQAEPIAPDAPQIEAPKAPSATEAYQSASSLATSIPHNGRVSIDSNKFGYLFGRVKPDPHNTPRSIQNVAAMTRLGIPDTVTGHGIIKAHLEEAGMSMDNILRTFKNEYGFFEVRESLLPGPSGKFTVLQSTWQVLPGGTRRFSTAIPLE
ncbi:MAG: VCBS repeat-containing protein, partial [Bacteroidetes bacterium]|nr:VCBS repeat-containing protein [Bacteroidota bacterium]